jgi:hypothetical protein
MSDLGGRAQRDRLDYTGEMLPVMVFLVGQP